MLEIKITKTTAPKAKPADESKLGFGKMFTDHMFIMLKHGSKVCGTSSGQLKTLHIVLQAVQIPENHIAAHLVVALEDTDVHLPGERLRTAEDGVGAGEKLPHQRTGGGHVRSKVFLNNLALWRLLFTPLPSIEL